MVGTTPVIHGRCALSGRRAPVHCMCAGRQRILLATFNYPPKINSSKASLHLRARNDSRPHSSKTKNMSSLLMSSETTTALVAGVAVAAVAYAASSRSQAQDDTLLTNGQLPRKINTPDTTLPVVGNLFDLAKHGETMYDWMLANSIHFQGEPWMFSVPGQPDTIMITKPEAIEEVTITQFNNFPKGILLDLFRDMFGEGLITSDGKRWHHQRKAAARFFSAKTLRALMMQSMQKNVSKMYDVIDEKAGGLFDLRLLFLEFTIETFAEMGLGVDLNCIGAAEPHPFQQGLDATAPIAARRFRVPGWLWKSQRALNLGCEAELAKQMKIVHAWLHETINASMEKIKSKETQQSGDGVKSVVELFIEFSGENVDGLKPEDLVDFLLTFVIAARDTTANTLSWMMFELARHPEIEQKIRDEMREQLGQDKIKYLTTDHTKGMTYLEATIKETIRLYPGAPLTIRQAAQDTVICNDVVVRKGQVIGMSAWVIARNPVVWGPDAAEFKPERWIDPATGQILQVPATKFFSFSAGPRTCIGMSMAMLSLRVVSANMLYRYRFDLDKTNDGTYVVAPTMNMKFPLLAKASLINHA